jgi:hypothetical protein
VQTRKTENIATTPLPWYPKSMLDTALLEALERLTPSEQQAILTVAKFLKGRNEDGVGAQALTDAVLAELPASEPRFHSTDEGLSPARLAARRFMRENPALMRLLAR